MSLHASLVLAREDANRLLRVFDCTGNFPDSAESLRLVLEASTSPSVSIITTANRITQMSEWLQSHGADSVKYGSIFEALHHALDYPFFEEHYNTNSSR